MNVAYFVSASVPSTWHRLLYLIWIIIHGIGISGKTGSEKLLDSSKVKKLVNGYSDSNIYSLNQDATLFLDSGSWFATYFVLLVGKIIHSVSSQILNLLSGYSNISLLILYGVQGTKWEIGKYCAVLDSYKVLLILL